ncbi:MAG: hypothetical protein R3F59_32770 [Myxococcota bacterium]
MDAAFAWVEHLRETAVVEADGSPGARSTAWAPSFARLRLEDPGRIVLWANRQGGFRVSCPIVGAPVREPWEAALTAWRTGDARPDAVRFRCPACGAEHALTEVGAAPPLAFAPWGLVTADVGGPDLAPGALAAAEAALGPLAAVLRRGG